MALCSHYQARWRRVTGISAIALVLLGCGARASAQDAFPAGGFQLLPPVPQQPPRPATGEWQSTPDKGPVTKFIDALKGNDAMIRVVVGQGKLLTLKDAVPASAARFIAVGDPTVVDFELLPNPRMIRIVGKRAGVTDLSITTADDQTYSFEVQVTWDLELAQAQLRQAFPDALIQLKQLREHIIVEGEVRSITQAQQVVQAIEAYQRSAQVDSKTSSTQIAPAPAPSPSDAGNNGNQADAQPTVVESGGRPTSNVTMVQPQVINLLRIPGVKQVMLQVRIAELNRTAVREIGADLFGVDPNTGTIVGTNISGNSIAGLAALGLGGLKGTATAANGPNATAFGIFPGADFAFILRALRKNSLLTILAEPNLVAMSGMEASFLAGGQFPVPVPQVSNGISNSITVQFKNFGVQLNFLPTVLDEETIRLSVNPEVSSIDFTLGTTLVQGGQPIPGLNTRRTSTTVELRQGETLAIAGLLSVQLEGQTARIPGIGDLPYIGPLFSNTSNKRTEKELLIMVTPVLVNPIRADQVGCLPGQEIKDPTDFEFYFKNRIEGRTPRPFRSTVPWDYRLHSQSLQQYDHQYVHGPSGFSD